MSRKVRVAIVGVGNCASSIVQGVHYYRNADEGDFIPGIMHPVLGGYHIRDVEFVAGFDINATKVGKDIAEAIYADPNNTFVFAQVPPIGAKVYRGPTMDGLGKYLVNVIKESKEPPVDVAKVLRDTGAEIVLNYLPVGSEEATRHYAQAAIDAGCAFVNGIPVFISSDPVWAKKFQDAGLPVLGDDIKSQVGATILHRVLVQLFNDRGVKLLRTSQLNVGGNTDFMNMLERERLDSKKKSKTQAVTSMIPYDMGATNVYIGPSDYVAWLEDRKWAHIRMEGQTFGDVPLNIELKLEVWDSPNSAGVMIDAVRCAKIAMDAGLSGPIWEPSSYFFKSPPKQVPDYRARQVVEEWVAKHAKPVGVEK